MKIEALHKFHDKDYSEEWAQRFTPSLDRTRLFNTILNEIKSNDGEASQILELGIGPGFLAEYLLKQLSNIKYEGLDFSRSMLEIAKKRTDAQKDQISFTQADLIKENWTLKLKRKPNVIVSTWALHDLFLEQHIFEVYQLAYKILPKGGILLNGDFIKPEESNHDYEGGRIKPSIHINLLKKAGFSNVQCLKEFEKNIDKPTTSNNYACFKAQK